MQLNETCKMAKVVTNNLRKNFVEKVDGCCIFDVIDDENNRKFSIEFYFYDYFEMQFDYDKGEIKCGIRCGDKSIIWLENSQKNFETMDFDVFCDELKREVELRIPDKFLESKGWK